MKTKFLLIMMIACIEQAYSQAPHTIRPHHPAHQLQRLTKIQGKVMNLVTNDDYIFDGFYLQTETQSLLVKFPPHMGTRLVPLLKKEPSIAVNGILEYPLFGGTEFRMVSLQINGTTIYDVPPSNPPTPLSEPFAEGSGKIIDAMRDRSGNINGFVLDSKVILRMPPHIASQISYQVNSGVLVTYTGLQKSLRDGEVQAENYKIVHCRTINLNGQEYFVR